MRCRDCSHDGTCGGACARRIAWMKHQREKERAANLNFPNREDKIHEGPP